jgi:hypothetical protein
MSSRGESSWKAKNNERKSIMKHRNIFMTMLLVLACFGPLTGIQAGNNTGYGDGTLSHITTGQNNSAFGWAALFSDNTGGENAAVGAGALVLNTSGTSNTAVGTSAMLHNTDGIANTAVGRSAMAANTTGDFNVAIGEGAGFGLTTGSNNTIIGEIAGGLITTANHVICIGAGGGNVSNSCFIGNIYSNIQPAVGTDPDFVTISSSGRLGRANLSSRRYKHDIKAMDKASEVLFSLKPVRFQYNKEYDATQTIAFGLIAEDVAEVAPALVGRNPKGEPESVRYEQINAMLLNEFLKEHKKVQDLETTVARQQKGMETLTAQLKDQAAQIQKVSAQLEVSKPPTQLALNTP